MGLGIFKIYLNRVCCKVYMAKSVLKNSPLVEVIGVEALQSGQFVAEGHMILGCSGSSEA